MKTSAGLAAIALSFLVPVCAACQSVLILPFENRSGDQKLEWIGEAMPELLAERLGLAGRYVITREEWASVAERAGLPSSSRFSRATMVKLGEELDADELVLGEFEAKHGMVWVSARILSLRGLSLRPTKTASGPLNELVSIGMNLGRQLIEQMDPALKQAREESEQASEIFPLGAVENLARSFMSSSATEQTTFLREAVRAAPRYFSAVFQFALAMFRQKDLKAAIAGFSKIPPEHRRYAEANFYLGLAYFDSNDPVKAQAALLNSASRAPVAPVFNNLAVGAARIGDMKKAGEYVARARELDASSNEIVFNSGLAAWRAGDAAAAARWLRQVLQSNGQDNLVRRLLTAVAEKLPPDQAEALKPPSSGELPAEITTEPTENELAAADRLMREWDETAARFAVLESQPAADISPRPRHGEIHLDRGREALTRGDLEAARQELSQALLLAPNSYEAHYSLGEAYRRLGRPAEAIRELKAALFEQDSIEARLLLASIYVDEQKWSEAEAEARNALRLDATNQEARELLAAAVARSRPPRQGRGDRPTPSAEKEP